jgi:hypothetical protein
MKTPATKSAARPARDSSNECGHHRVPPRVDPSGRINFFRTKKNRTPSMRGAAVGVWPLMLRIGGVDSVHTFGFGLGRTSVGSGRIPHVSAGAQCLQGLECSSSPTSGTCFPCSGPWGPLSVDKLSTCRPFGGLFCWWTVLLLDGSFLQRFSPVAVYLFMVGRVWDCMTWRRFGK